MFNLSYRRRETMRQRHIRRKIAVNFPDLLKVQIHGLKKQRISKQGGRGGKKKKRKKNARKKESKQARKMKKKNPT